MTIRNDLRVCLVVNDFPAASETFIVRKARSLVERGVTVTVFRHAPGPAGDGAVGPAGVQVVDRPRTAGQIARLLRPGCSGGLAWQRRAWVTAVERFGRSQRAVRAWALAAPIVDTASDIVHFEFSGIAVTYADALELLRPAKLVVSCRGASEQITPLVDPRRATDLAQVLPLFNRIHCVSDDMATTVRALGAPLGSTFVNRPAVPVGEFAWRGDRRRHERFRIASVGRFHWKKSLETLIQAVRLLRDGGQSVEVRLAGSGLEEEKLRYLVHWLGLDQHVAFLGLLPPPAIRQVLEESDVFVLSSISEGLSNAALEAMAVGLPVVSTDIGGMDEVIVDSVNGFLVPPLDPAALAGVLQRLALEEGLGRRIGREARATVVRSFDLARQGDAFLDEYRRLRGED